MGSRNKRQELGNLAINFENFQVHVDEEPIDLTLTEFEALRILLAGLDRILPYESISMALWQVADHRRLRNLAVLIHRLRRKLTKSSPFVIQTIRGRGYGLIDARPLSKKPPERATSRRAGRMSSLAIMA
jgi:two-component system response regulator VicR